MSSEKDLNKIKKRTNLEEGKEDMPIVKKHRRKKPSGGTTIVRTHRRRRIRRWRFW